MKNDEIRRQTADSKIVLDEINRLLEGDYFGEALVDMSDNENIISLYHIFKYLIQKKSSYSTLLKLYNDQLGNAYPDKSRIFEFTDFDYNTCKIGIKEKKAYYYGVLYLYKQNGDLFLEKSSYPIQKEEVYRYLGAIISKYYDAMLEYKGFVTENASIGSVNSLFTIYFDENQLTVKYNDNPEAFMFTCYFDKNDITYQSESYLISEAITNKYRELLKNIYVHISSCPEWCRDDLSSMRKQQLKRISTVNEVEEEGKKSFVKTLFNIFS